MKKEEKKEINAKEHNHHKHEICDCGHDCGCC